MCWWTVKAGDKKWWHNDAIVERVFNIDQNSRSQTAMESVWLVSTKSVGSRPSASCEFCSHRRRRRDATRQLSRICVGGLYWASRNCLKVKIVRTTRIGVGDGGRQGGHVPPKFGKKNFGQFLWKIRAFSGKNHVKLGILLIFRVNIIKIRVFW